MKHTIALAFLSIVFLSACSRTSETQPIINPIPTTQVTGQAYTLTEVATHNTSRSCWSIIHDKVYDFTSWIEKHPGGPEAILKICGIDGTAVLQRAHGSTKDNSIEQYYVGDLTK